MKRRGFNKNRLLQKLDEEVRNALIVNSWELLSEFTEIKYRQKVEYLMEQYHLSFSRIEDIINLEKHCNIYTILC